MELSLLQRLRPVIIFFGVSFLLHLLWENAQAPLFVGYESLAQHFWICFKATGGDLLFMFIIYATLAVVHRDPFWIANRSSYTHPATWILPPFIGVLLATNMELWAIFVDQRWQYAEAMPMIPILSVALIPILQMIIIPPLTIFISSRFPHRL